MNSPETNPAPKTTPPQGGLSTWAIRSPIPTLIFFVVMTIAGWMAFDSMRINNFPDVDMPVVSVIHVQPGAAPAELENQVTRIVEDSLSGLGSVRSISSRIYDGQSVTVVEFQLGVDLEKATNDVRNAVAGVRSNLPADVQDPIIQREEASPESLYTFTVRGDGLSPEQLSWFVDNDIAKKILSNKGVSKIERRGGVDREIRIDLDPVKLAAKGITAAEVSRQLRQTNINLPGGRLDIGGQEQSIRTIGSAASIEAFANTRIVTNNGQSLKLNELGAVVDSWGEPRSRARFNGSEVVAFDVYRSRGSSEVDVANAILKTVDQLNETQKNVQIQEVTSSVEFVKESYLASIETLGIGALLAILVVWWFLRDLRATFVTAVAMPMSLLPTFFVMYMLNDSFNVVSLLALSLTIGILVDDAIVEIENIVRHMNEGKPPFEAALEAADEIGLAVVATTATIIAVFAPVGFMPGVVGQFFKSFALAACVSVFFSLVVARTLTPLMGAYILRSYKEKHGEPFWMKGYLSILKALLTKRIALLNTHIALWLMVLLFGGLGLFFIFKPLIDIINSGAPKDWVAVGVNCFIGLILALIGWFFFGQINKKPAENLQLRWLVLTAGIGFFAGSIMIASILPGEFIPVGDSGRSFMSIERPPGTRMDETDSVVIDIMSELKSRPEVKSVYASMGLRTANIVINLKPRHERALSQQAFEKEFGVIAGRYAGTRISFGEEGGGGGIINFSLVSDDPVALEKVTRQLEREMRSLSSIKNIASSENLTRPEVLISPKPDQAARMGVSTATLSDVARVATVGDYDTILAKYNIGDRQIPIRVLMKSEARADVKSLLNLQVPTQFGTNVPLSAVADVRFGAGPVTIKRINRSRSVTIKADLVDVAAGVAQEQVRDLPAYKNKPESVREELIGEAQAQAEMAAGFGMAIVTGIMLMYVVLVLLFKSFTHPLTILSALPLSFGGAFFLLLISSKSISMPVLIGMIMLTGIAAKNSILLVEYAIVAVEKGMSRMEALMDAAHKRARPILMTTVAMGAGMLPIALGWGADVAFRSPMAIAVIGGLITSTLLSLLFVPVFYTLVDDLGLFFKRRFSHYFNAEKDDPESQ